MSIPGLLRAVAAKQTTPPVIPEAAAAFFADTAKTTVGLNGHIVVRSTASADNAMPPAALDLFSKSSVFLGAITAALASKNKRLWDADAVAQILSASGLTVELETYNRKFKYSNVAVQLNTAIIKDIFGLSLADTEFAEAAKGVVLKVADAIKSISATGTSDTSKYGHMILAVEYLHGMSVVGIANYAFNLKAVQSAANLGNCATVTTQNIDLDYSESQHMFVDPEFIKKFAPDMATTSEYKELIARLAAAVTS